MTILDKIEQQRIGYIVETGRDAKYVFLGYQEIAELDKVMNMLTFRVKGMEVVACGKERHVSVGDKYAEV